MNGVLVVDKPSGPSSHDVVARVRRLLGVRRVGHTGTLDPLATGVLPLVVGRATRLASFFSSTDKEYVADVRFGASTATFDAAQFPREPAPPEPAGLSRSTVEAALPEFVGPGWQMPPPYSAKKVEGVRAYERARRDQPVTLRPVRVTVHSAALEDYSGGRARIRLSCSCGYYVRTFAHDLGQRLGCGAYLEGLRRTRAGDFSLEQAVPMDRLEAEGSSAAAHLIPLQKLLPELPGLVLNDRGVRRASHGNAISLEDVASRADGVSERGSSDGARPLRQLRLLDGSGMLLGIAEVQPTGLLHPVIVLV